MSMLYLDPDTLVITRCPIIPAKEHHGYCEMIDTELLKDLDDLSSPEYILNSAMCYGELEVFVARTPSNTCINEFCNTCNVHVTFKKIPLTFLAPSLTQGHAQQLKDKLCSLENKG